MMGNYRAMLLGLVALNLVGAVVITIDAQLYPSFVVYPLLLLIGSYRLVRGDGGRGTLFLGLTGVIFVLVHFPFTPFGPQGSACEPGCASDAVSWTVVFALPLLMGLAGLWAYRRTRATLSQDPQTG